MAVVDGNLRSNAFPVNLIIGYYQSLLATKISLSEDWYIFKIVFCGRNINLKII